jgi:aldose 1-epimerase
VNEQNTIVEIRNRWFRLGIAPNLGGSIAHLGWIAEGRAEVDLLRRGSAADIASGNPSRLASFVMVPFTNRIDAGRIPLPSASDAGDYVDIPINRPAQYAAIHGFGRLAAWEVTEATSSKLRLTQSFRDAGNPYEYQAEQMFELGQDDVACSVRVTNQGSSALPFGIGFHPWFDRTPAATLTLQARQAFRMDSRDMPLEPVPLKSVFGTRDNSTGIHAMVIERQTPFDTPVSGWSGQALITWPELKTALSLKGEGALTLVHIFSPKQPAVFCVEPVSHMPDVVNRRHLAEFGDMTRLEPGASMEGRMRLTPSALD